MGDSGVAFSSGPLWKELRMTTLQILREFGMGSSSLAEKIQEEVNCFVNKLAEQKGEVIDLQHYTHVSVSNVICSIILGKRFSYEDSRFKITVESLTRIAESARGAAAINFLPFLKYLPGDMFQAKKIQKNWANVKDMIVEIISEMIPDTADTQSTTESAPNYISSYRRRQQEKVKKGKRTYLDDENLTKSVIDLFGAGTETVSSTIAWCVLFILHSTDVQKKVHAELDREIGQERQPTMEDQARLPYLGAVIKETQRLASIVPFSLLHKTSEEIAIHDFVIPKGTTVIPNLDSVLHDPKIWGYDADRFNPGRFLDKDGSLLQREEFLPFSIGPRLCVGEAMAKVELFLFMSSMFHRFEILATETLNPPSLKPNIGITSVPESFRVLCRERFKDNLSPQNV